MDLQRFLEQQLRIEGQSLSYPNLIEGLIRNPGNVQTLEDLSTENSAVIGMEFATLRDFFPSIEVSSQTDLGFPVLDFQDQTGPNQTGPKWTGPDWAS